MIEDIISSVVSNITSHSFIKFFERKGKILKNSKNTKSKKISTMPKNNNLINTTQATRIEGNCIKNCTTAISIQGIVNSYKTGDKNRY